jgi:hypothetical protein
MPTSAPSPMKHLIHDLPLKTHTAVVATIVLLARQNIWKRLHFYFLEAMPSHNFLPYMDKVIIFIAFEVLMAVTEKYGLGCNTM